MRTLWVCETGKIEVVMSKLVYLGQAILDLSKLVMYEFYYDCVIPKYGLRVKLFDMDTNSLVYHIKTEDFYAKIAGDVYERFDMIGYNASDASPLPVGVNKKVIGLMKDELGGKIMTEFVVLTPKLYAYKKLDNPEDKKCKRVKKCVVKHMISFDDYKSCLLDLESKSIYRLQLMFRNAKHEIHTVEVNKVALNRDDDKRIVKSSIVYGGTSAFLLTSAYFEKSSAKFDRNITNAKLGILYSGNFLETICWEILGNYMLENSWKPYSGKFGWMPAAF